MKKVKKYTLTLALVLAFIFLIPRFTTSLLDLKQKIENEKNYQKFLKEEALKKIEEEAREKIYLLGKFDPAQMENFVEVPAEYSISGYKMYLRKETLNAFLKMQNAAMKDNINLKLASATRNFDYQKELWNNEWTGVTLVGGKDLSKSVTDGQKRIEKILEYIAVPGTSRHHWGTDIDINGASLKYFETEKGKEVYAWLTKNAPSFGFCQTYTLKGSDRPTGYNEEKWHWSYLPLSREFTKEYKRLIKDSDINGFEGDIYVPELNLINNYVSNINPECI